MNSHIWHRSTFFLSYLIYDGCISLSSPPLGLHSALDSFHQHNYYCLGFKFKSKSSTNWVQTKLLRRLHRQPQCRQHPQCRRLLALVRPLLLQVACMQVFGPNSTIPPAWAWGRACRARWLGCWRSGVPPWLQPLRDPWHWCRKGSSLRGSLQAGPQCTWQGSWISSEESEQPWEQGQIYLLGPQCPPRRRGTTLCREAVSFSSSLSPAWARRPG